jgi:hypothetical protein
MLELLGVEKLREFRECPLSDMGSIRRRASVGKPSPEVPFRGRQDGTAGTLVVRVVAIPACRTGAALAAASIGELLYVRSTTPPTVW